MENSKIIENLKATIEELYKENKELKEKVEAYEVSVKYQDDNYAETLEKAKQIMVACEQSKQLYETALKEYEDKINSYNVAIKEVYKLKQKYEQELNKMIDLKNNIRKGV